MLRFTILLICVLVPLTISKNIKPLTNDIVCNNPCEYGYILDGNGRSTCQCKQSPCENGQAPLSDHFCGRGPNSTNCPSGSVCIIAPNDVYAVCCPSNQQSAAEPMTTTTKPVTKGPTEPITKAPTQSMTKAPTGSITKAPTEPMTKAPTESITKVPTEPITKVPAEPMTQAPTESMTKAPTEPMTK
ncbi:unnamed protein product, partial [Rotaria sordida]